MRGITVDFNSGKGLEEMNKVVMNQEEKETLSRNSTRTTITEQLDKIWSSLTVIVYKN